MKRLPGFEHIESSAAGAHSLPSAKLKPGEFYVSCYDEEIVTILGSCITVCMWDATAGFGGMNHFLLPTPEGNQAGSARYGSCAIEALIGSLMECGASFERLQVKVAGGGNIGQGDSQVARRNIQFADQFLAQSGLKPLVRDVGGSQPRKLRFHPLTGRLRIQRLPALSNEREVSSEFNEDFRLRGVK